jgi:hypothetical protein
MLTFAGQMIMKSFRNFSSPFYAALLAAPLLLAACTENGPWPMPTGYTYHHDQYKAPPGPKPVLKKWEYKHGLRPEPQPIPMSLETTTTTTVITAAPITGVESSATGPATVTTWQLASDELVARLISDFGRPTESVWLVGDGAGSPEFDRVLRRSLGASKIDIADTPGGGPFSLHYSVGSSGDSAGHWLLTITLMSGPTRLESESGLYGFSDGVSAPSVATGSFATDAPIAITGPAPSGGPALVIDATPVPAHARPVRSGLADDIEPGPTVRPIVPEHRLND